MKVTTDGILFGSWCNPLKAKRILDIGIGTGLLSLMLAQKTSSDVHITGVELDESAAVQAQQNVDTSPWAERIQVVQSSIQDFSDRHLRTDNQELFDVIVSNPPWFAHTATASHNKYNQTRDGSRTLARQQLGLSLSTLLDVCRRLLVPDGQMYLILPVSAQAELLSLAQTQDFAMVEKCNVSASPDHHPHCQMWRFVKLESSNYRIPVTNSHTDLIIKDHQQAYSKEFVALCQDYYLKF